MGIRGTLKKAYSLTQFPEVLAFAIITILFSLPILGINFFWISKQVIFPIERYAIWVELVFEVAECVLG